MSCLASLLFMKEVSSCRYIAVSLYRYIAISLYRYIAISPYRYIAISPYRHPLFHLSFPKLTIFDVPSARCSMHKPWGTVMGRP